MADAVLRSRAQGVFLMDGKARVLQPVPQSVGLMFGRQDFGNLTFEKLIAPVVTAKTLTAVRIRMAALAGTAADAAAAADAAGTPDAAAGGPDAAAAPDPDFFAAVEVRLAGGRGTSQIAHYSFEFEPISVPPEPRTWLVHVADVSTRVRTLRELDELRSQVQTHGEILRCILRWGMGRFGGFLRLADASLQTVATVLRKPAREEHALRRKLERAFAEVGHVRREAAILELRGLENAAHAFAAALEELRGRGRLSGSDFLLPAKKLEQMCGQFALLKSLTAAAGSLPESIVDQPRAAAAAQPTAAAGSLENALQALTAHIAHENSKQVTLDCTGLQLVPAAQQAAVKNIVIQFIRNGIIHGIEMPAVREAAGKTAGGMLRLEIRLREDNLEILFEDDGRGMIADEVRAAAVERGVITREAAARMRDREAIKLIFKSRFTTLASPAADAAHGAGLSMVRRYVHQAGGKIALASLAGHETRFKITLPVCPEPAAVKVA